MKALAACWDENITAAAKPVWPCASFPKISDLRASHWNIPDPRVSLSSAAINNMGSRAYSDLWFGAFWGLQRNVCFLWQTFIHILDILQFYKKRQKKSLSLLEIDWDTKAGSFFLIAISLLCANALNIQSV